MGKEHHPFQDELSYAITWAHHMWRFWKAFFGATGGVETLNKRTDRIFGHFQTAMADQIILQLAKVLDNDPDAVSLSKAIAQLGDHQPEKTTLQTKLAAVRN